MSADFYVCEGCGARSEDACRWGVTSDGCDLCPACFRAFKEELRGKRVRGIVEVHDETEVGRARRVLGAGDILLGVLIFAAVLAAASGVFWVVLRLAGA